jgi:hypothetical protein
VYFEEGYPLDDARSMEDLYRNLSDRRAFAIPHHTAYAHGHRSKEWDVFEPDVSPVMEIFSGQGSSEDINTPIGMHTNPSMGPRTSGSTFVDGLDRGHRVGVIASNDWTGLPGSWNSGLAGIWAGDLTREGIWEAIESRRTYGVTGDRMRLWFEIDGHPMGTVISGASPMSATIDVDCPQPLDRIELVHNGEVAYTYNHRPELGGTTEESVWRLLVEFGWGPDPRNDFDCVEERWIGDLVIDDGELIDVTPRFSGFGQSYELERRNRCGFDIGSSREATADFQPSRAHVYHHRQGLILTIEGTEDTDVTLDLDGEDAITRPIGDLDGEADVIALTDEAERRIREEFGVTRERLREDMFARDLYYSNARKIKFHPAYPLADCSTRWTVDLPSVATGTDYYYARVSQINGQYAWSSPIWIEG